MDSSSGERQIEDDDLENNLTQESLVGGNTCVKKSRKPPYIYLTGDDLKILREVLLEQPFGKNNAKAWTKIFSACDIPVKDGDALKRRFKLLMDNFTTQNLKSLRGSGLEEEYDEKMKLLQDITDVMNDYKTKQTDRDDTKQKEAELGMEKAQTIRDAALQNFTKIKKPEELGSPKSEPNSEKKTPKHDKFFSIIEQSDYREHELKRLKLEQEDRRLNLQERDMKLREEELKQKKLDSEHQRSVEEKKLVLEELKVQADLEEKKMLYKLLQKQLGNTI